MGCERLRHSGDTIQHAGNIPAIAKVWFFSRHELISGRLSFAFAVIQSTHLAAANDSRVINSVFFVRAEVRAID